MTTIMITAWFLLADGEAAGVNTSANIISAVAACFTALSLVITALALWHKQTAVGEKVDKVHTIVNQEKTDGANFRRALIRALEEAGVAVPIDQSLPAQDPPTPPAV